MHNGVHCCHNCSLSQANLLVQTEAYLSLIIYKFFISHMNHVNKPHFVTPCTGFQCGLCGHTFSERRDLEEHQEDIHSNGDRPRFVGVHVEALGAWLTGVSDAMQL